jgi:UDP-N-acetylglucosamine transferase subunit ALG13
VIFLTVGTHEPFDRLVQAVDNWCRAADCGGHVFGQITRRARYHPSQFEWTAQLSPRAFLERCHGADFIVSHAGMGSIITALMLVKPVLVVPRRAMLGETRNDHQLTTARRFRDRPGIWVAEDEDQLSEMLTKIRSSGRPTVDTGPALTPFAQPELSIAIRDFIFKSGEFGK